MDDGEARMVWFTSGYFIDDDMDDIVSGGNSTLLLSSLKWLSDSQNSIIIDGKDISTSYLTISTSMARVWNIILIGVVPGLILIGGIIIWYRRKNR